MVILCSSAHENHKSSELYCKGRLFVFMVVAPGGGYPKHCYIFLATQIRPELTFPLTHTMPL
jgi:hypothetical protein